MVNDESMSVPKDHYAYMLGITTWIWILPIYAFARAGCLNSAWRVI